jgi:hypothetical protein
MNRQCKGIGMAFAILVINDGFAMIRKNPAEDRAVSHRTGLPPTAVQLKLYLN